ncbi:putative ribonuclease H-like domain-containing protein [Tanacetum coccineum]
MSKVLRKETNNAGLHHQLLLLRNQDEEVELLTVPENNTTSTPSVSTGSQPVNTGRLNHDDSLMPELEIFHKPETGIFDKASYDEEGVIMIKVFLKENCSQSLLYHLGIQIFHPKVQYLDESKLLKEPKKIAEALRMMLGSRLCRKKIQFKLQHVGVLVDLPQGLMVIGTNEEVYVSQPPGFVDPDHPTKVYKVVKALGTIDKTLFIKRDKKDIMLVQVYVDDIIFGSTNKSWCDEFEALMKSRFQMSSIGELTFFLGLQVKQNKGGIFISQDKYVAEILKKFNIVNVKAAITPMETKMPLTKDEEAFDVDVHLYRSMIGSLMYLTASRPDIMYAVCVCSRFQVTPKTSHLNAVKRIFKYLKGKSNLGLWYPRESPFDLEAFSDSDYGGSNLDRKSTTGGCQFLGQRLISWQCKKQTIMATSTTKAEYVAAANCCGQYCDKHNQVGFLRKPDESAGFAEIVDFLRGSNLRYTISKASIRDSLQLEDASGITMLPNDELFEGMGQIGSKVVDGISLVDIATAVIFGNMERAGFRGGTKDLYAFYVTCAITPNAGQEHDAVAPSQPSSSTPPVPSTSSPPVITTPTPPPIHTPPPPPIHTPTPPLIHTPTPAPIPDTEPTPFEHVYEEASPLGDGSQTNQADHGKCHSEVNSEEEEPEAQGRKSQDDPLDSSVQGLVTPSSTRVNASGEEQVEDISPNTLEAAKTLSKVASLKTRSIDKGRRYKRRKEAKGKKVVSSLDFQEEVDAGAEQVNTASAEQVSTAEGVNTGSIKLSTGDEQLSTGNEQVSTVGAEKSTSDQDKGQREGKAPMISEETPKKSKEQVLQEEASLAEAIRLDTLQREEVAKQVHLDSLLAQRIAEEEELNEQQKKRKAQVHARSEVTRRSFAKKMVDLVNQRKKYFAEERARAKRNKPMTQSQLKTYMMNYLKNQGTWKLSQLKNLSFEEVKKEFDKLVKQVESFAPINFEATKASLKRFGEELQTKTPKRKKDDEAKDDEPTKKSGKRRKQMARKGLHTSIDKDDSEDSDEVGEQDDSVTGTKTPINPVPVAMKTPSIATYKIIKQGEKGVYQIVREDGTDIVYINFGAMMKSISRDDLTELYRIVMNRYGMNGPEDELERVFWKYLKNMFEEPLLHKSMDVYMLIERTYPLSAEMCKAMLDKKLQGGKPDENCYKMLKMMEKQAGIRKTGIVPGANGKRLLVKDFQIRSMVDNLQISYGLDTFQKWLDISNSPSFMYKELDMFIKSTMEVELPFLGAKGLTSPEAKRLQDSNSYLRDILGDILGKDMYYPLTFDTSAGNPVKEILLKLNLPDHRSILTDSKVTPTKHRRMTNPYSSPRFIANYLNARYLKMEVKRRSVKVKELQERCIIKAFKLTNPEKYEHVSPNVTSLQDGKVYKMATRDYAWLMISRSSRSHSR